ncbi:MAG: hypothetical protein EPO24_03950 [Bacteroidetes bacterium]|nr:MAG: hypothetical protein EPO24_03950 [Bacteroidota bacterium]
MANHSSQASLSISIKNLDRMIRRAVREELSELVQKQGEMFSLEPGTPLYDDMKAIARQKKQGKIRMYSREEAYV